MRSLYTHFIYGFMENDNSESESEISQPPHGLLFPISSNPTDKISHTNAFVTPVVEHRLQCEIGQ